MNQADLAGSAKVGLATVKRIESAGLTPGGNVQTLMRIQRALESAGVEFIDECDSHGHGVRMKKRFAR